MASAIIVEALSKKYVLAHQRQGAYGSLRDTLAEGARSVLKRLAHPLAARTEETREEFWALKDINLEIQRGDRIAIIGRNGAGKSTLLKLLSRITEPTSGRISITGRVASLLEVGTGFHPELTGRENIFLNGVILGMSKREIKASFDQIVAFAEIEKFLDTPVKRYSSGMYVRLAFAVAAHLETEILILDEVLAVGDAQFQKKCMGKMDDVSKEGRTVLFVSHNMQAVQAFCNRAVLLNGGKLATQGDTQVVVNEYLTSKQYLPGGGLETLDRTWPSAGEAPGNENVQINRIRVVPNGDAAHELVTVKVPLKIEFYYSLSVPIESFVFAMHFRKLSGELIFVTGSTHTNVKPGSYKSTGYIPGNFLNNGIYSMTLFFARDISTVLFSAPEVMVFEVHDAERDSGWLGEYPGAVRPRLEWDFELVPREGQ